jgi:uncharacterized protein (TIGR03790 family)
LLRLSLLLWLASCAVGARAESLNADRLGVIYNRDDKSSTVIAAYYAERRHVPAANVIGLSVPKQAIVNREQLKQLRSAMFDNLPTSVESLLLVWSRPYAVECMSITTAFAAGYQPGFCEPGCEATIRSPLYDSSGWLPADTVGWLPAMLLPSDDEALARAVIDRGIRADGSSPKGTVYLIRSQDKLRNVRASGYLNAETLLAGRVSVLELTTPVERPASAAIAYFTGVAQVSELPLIGFLPGAAADHLTSYGGVLDKSPQMSAVQWLTKGATASYGTVTEPCNRVEKFPSAQVFMDRYLRGDTLLEAYWKSVAMPGQGLFLGEPLARPFGSIPR